MIEDDSVRADAGRAPRGSSPRGGTILGTSRTNPYAGEGDGTRAQSARSLESQGVDALIAIGGEDTLGVAARLAEGGLPVVGVPKTIDNDLGGTDFTFGFHTAVQIATDAIDRLHTTAESHNRVIVVEVMGRHAGWIATYAGIAGGADVILVPERPFDIDEVCASCCAAATTAARRSRSSSSPRARRPTDGAPSASRGEQVDAFGHARLGGIGVTLEREIEARTGFETRTTILGHVQRGGTPTGVRPRARDPLRGRGDGRGRRAGDSAEMVALRGAEIVLGAARRGDCASQSCSTRRSTRPPRSSSAERRAPVRSVRASGGERCPDLACDLDVLAGGEHDRRGGGGGCSDLAVRSPGAVQLAHRARRRGSPGRPRPARAPPVSARRPRR